MNFLKSISSLLLVFISGLACADPVHLLGEYKFNGLVTPLGRYTIDIIDTRAPDAEARLSEVRKLGGVCELRASHTYRCSRFSAPGTVPAASLQAIATQHTGLAVNFIGTEKAAPQIVSKGEAMTEWSISQAVQWPSGTADGFLYRDLTLANGAHLIKLVLESGPNSNTAEFILPTEADRLQKFAEWTVSEGRWRWHNDIALVELTHLP